MDPYKPLKLILENPSNPRAYEKLAEYYISKGQINEGESIVKIASKLIENKFNQNEKTNNSNVGEKP